MQLYIKQRVFSWTDTYDVYDETDQAKYFVKADLLAIGHVIRVFDKRTGEQLGMIKQKIITMLPAFEISIHGNVVGEIRKRFSLFSPKYDVDCNGWRVEGDFFGWDYDVMGGCSSVIHISKQLFQWGDTYVLDFVNPSDELMGLLLVIAIDAANCNN